VVLSIWDIDLFASLVCDKHWLAKAKQFKCEFWSLTKPSQSMRVSRPVNALTSMNNHTWLVANPKHHPCHTQARMLVCTLPTRNSFSLSWHIDYGARFRTTDVIGQIGMAYFYFMALRERKNARLHYSYMTMTIVFLAGTLINGSIANFTSLLVRSEKVS
jgi:hypothetical protein